MNEIVALVESGLRILLSTELLVAIGVLLLYPFLLGLYALRDGTQNPYVLYHRLRPFVFGGRLFLRMVHWINPYGASIGYWIKEFHRDKIVLAMKQRKAVQNPFGSVHAVALVLLAETASGLCVLGQLARKDRGIVTAVRAEYKQKAKGEISATCSYALPKNTGAETRKWMTEIPVPVRDGSGNEVAVVYIKWAIEQPPSSSSS